MNDILATFTRSEKWLISFVLMLIGSGYGLQEFHSSQQNTMTFSATSPAPDTSAIDPLAVMPAGMSATGRVDINQADAKLLETLPGVGPALAGALIRAREANGPFKTLADLDAVPGIGPAMMSKLSPLVDLGPAAALPPSQVQALSPVSQNLATVPVSEATTININSATAEQLDHLTGVGPAIAKRIIEDRQMRGAYRSPEELMRVKGIGVSILQKNIGRITVQ